MMDSNSQVRVSILIPNYNNGRQSSRSGNKDFIGELLQSLHDTLSSDPTPFEVIVFDDGSTDDSLETLRAWSRRTWPSGRPFLELIEAPHCGVLAKTANVMSRKARGDILARLDGDVVCLTPQWVTRLCQIFDRGPQRLGVVGPKQLRPDMRIHAYGDWILHPKGYTHIASGMDRHAVRHPMEVDHVMGCFYCCRKAVFDDLNGYDENFLRGQTIDFGLRARLHGWSCIAVPDIEFLHNHGLRATRQTTADTPDGVRRSLKVFEDKWGFNRLAPDLDVVRQRYTGTPLLWNRRWFGNDQGRSDPHTSEVFSGSAAAVTLESSNWARYAQDAAVRRRVDTRVGAAMEVVRHTGVPRCAAVLSRDAGLAAHILAMRGLPCVAMDTSAERLALAQQCTGSARQQYPASPPRFVHQTDPRAIPLADGETDLLLLFDIVEHHRNPVGLLREARRVLQPNRLLVIVSERQVYSPGFDPSDPSQASNQVVEHRYHWHELVMQVQVVGGWALAVDPSKDDPRRDMILIARRLPDAKPAPQPAAAPAGSPPVVAPASALS